MKKICSICLSEKIKLLKSPLTKLCLVCKHSELIQLSSAVLDYSIKSNRNFSHKIEKVKNNERAKILNQYGWSGGTVLEIGCAEGRLTQHLLKKKIKAPQILIGVEPSVDANIARKYFHDVYSDIKKIPKNKYNLIYCFHVLEHIKNPIKLLNSIHSLLDPEGTLIIEIPNRSGSVYAQRDFNPEHVHAFSISSIAILLEKANLSVESMNCSAYESPVYDNSIRLICKNNIKPELRILENFKKLDLLNNPIIIAGLGNDFKKFILPVIKQLEVKGLYDKNKKNIYKGYKRIMYEDLSFFEGNILISSFSSGLEIKKDIANISKLNSNIKIIELQELLS